MYIKQPEVPAEYPFSLATINRWRRDGTLTTFRQGKRRVLLLRTELDALVLAKEKVAVGSSDEEVRNEGVNSQIRCKDTTFSSDKKNITINKCIKDENEDSRSEE